MFSLKSKITGFLLAASITACLGAAPAAAQINNPGVQQSGAVTPNNLAVWGPGVGQIHDGGPAPAGTISSISLTSPGATLNIGGSASPCAGPSCAFTVDLPNKITGGSAGDASHTVVLTFDNQGRLTAAVATLISIPFTQVTGTLGCAQLPAFTGDVTNTACATVVGKVNGVSYPASPSTDTVPIVTAANTAAYQSLPNGCAAIVYSTSTHTFSCGTVSGNTTTLVTKAAGATTAGHVATWDANGNVQDGGAAGTGTVTSVACGTGLTGGTITTTGTCAINAGAVPGIATNTAAAAGNVGEVISSNLTTGSLSSGSSGVNCTSLSLTAGDWLVSAQVQFNTSGNPSVTDYQASISLTTAVVNAPITGTQSWHDRVASTADHQQGTTIVASQVLLSATTTVFFNIATTFTGGTSITASCSFYARRFR